VRVGTSPPPTWSPRSRGGAGGSATAGLPSQTGGRLRSATIVSITNQSAASNSVFVSFFKGFDNNSSPAGVAAFVIPPDFTVYFASWSLPGEVTAVVFGKYNIGD